MSAANYDILIEQGATFSLTLTMRDGTGSAINLTGQSFRGWIKKSFTDVSSVAEFSCTLLDQSEPETVGKVIITLSAAVTEALPVNGKGTSRTITKMVYDVESEDNTGYVVRWLQGVASISPEVTTA